MKKTIITLALPLLLLSSCSNQGGGASLSGEEGSYELRKAYRAESAYLDRLEDLKISVPGGKWIWDKDNSKNCHFAFRKSFTLDELPSSSIAYISADSRYYLWVNERLVVFDGSLKRGMTSCDSYADKIDLAPYLKKGENLLAFLVDVNARTGYSSVDSGSGGLFFYMKAGNQTIASDRSWKMKKHSGYLKDNEGAFVTGALAERPINYDARKDDVGDFKAKDYDDSSWEGAYEICSPGEEPFGDFFERAIPLFDFDSGYKDFLNSDDYLNVKFTEEKTIELRLPKNSQVSLYFELEDEKGGNAIKYYGKYADEVLAHVEYYATKQGSQSFESLPYKSGESVMMKVPAGIAFKRLAYRESSYATSYGEFSCSDTELASLYEKSKNTLSVCMRDNFMDCPDRERGSYTGDSSSQARISFALGSPSSNLLLKKLYLTELGFTESDHVIKTIAPGKYADGEIADQNLNLLTTMHDYYLYTGDRDTLSRFYPLAKDYLSLWAMGENGLPVYRPGEFEWGDWGEDPIDKKPLQDAWYYCALNNVYQVAKACSFEEDLSFFESRMSSIKENYARVYRKTGGYASEEGVYDERVQAIVALSGLYKEEEKDDLIAFLSDESHYICSPYMELYCEWALSSLGAVKETVSRIKTRYRAMIDSEDTTTLWEGWEEAPLGSRNHAWSGAPGFILTSYLAGVRPNGKGYESYLISPADIGEDYSCKTLTDKGTISLSLAKKDGVSSFAIETVEDADCEIRVPTSFGASCVLKQGEASFLGEKDGHYLFRVQGKQSLRIEAK